jgi:hypothetical protein
MATVSFDKSFVITDEQVIGEFKNAAANPVKVVVHPRDYDSERDKGIELFRNFSRKKRSSSSTSC